MTQQLRVRSLRIIVIGIVALAFALPAVADARAPVLRSVSQHGDFAAATWSLPFGVDAIVIEVAKDDPGVNRDGYFFQRNLITIDIPDKKTDSSIIVDTKALSPGTYYLHVAGQDLRYRSCPPREWSDTFRLIITADHTGVGGPDVAAGSPACPASSRGSGGGGGGGTGGGGGGGVIKDTIAPLQTVRAPSRQDVDKLYVTSVMNEPGTLTATGSVSVPGAAKVYRFKRITRTARANVKTKLRLKLARKSLRAVKRALRQGKRLTAKIKITARDRAGNSRVERRAIRLRL